MISRYDPKEKRVLVQAKELGPRLRNEGLWAAGWGRREGQVEFKP